jgi:hypothetical protein
MRTKPELYAETIEEAIELALKEQDEVRVEWYSLGKTNEDFKAYLKAHGIKQKERGIFIAGNEFDSLTAALWVMPRSWIVEDSSVPWSSEEIDPHLQPKTL